MYCYKEVKGWIEAWAGVDGSETWRSSHLEAAASGRTLLKHPLRQR